MNLCLSWAEQLRVAQAQAAVVGAVPVKVADADAPAEQVAVADVVAGQDADAFLAAHPIIVAHPKIAMKVTLIQ